MVKSLTGKAQRRAELLEGQITAALQAGNTKQAMVEALAALRSEMAKYRGWHPDLAPLVEAQLAASIAATAVRLYLHKPRRAPGQTGRPGPAEIRATFDAAYRNASEEG